MTLETISVFAVIGVISLLCQWVAWKTKAPSIVFLLVAGIILGPVLHVFNADELMGDLLFPIVSLSVAIILFEGSLTLRFHELSQTSSVVWRMLTIGALVTWVVVSTGSHFLIGLSWELSILIGAILIVTGPTVIGPMLRSVRPTEKVEKILQWEGIVIDPLGAVLAILVFDVIIAAHGNQVVSSTMFLVAQIVTVGMLCGCLSGYVYGLVLRNHWLPEYLQNAGTLLVVVAVFALSESFVHESGLLAVTAMGIWLGNMKDVHTDAILHFKESISVILISGLFILLASRLDLKAVAGVLLGSIGLFLVVQFVARPLNILVSTLPAKLSWNERALLSWIAPRGIVAAAIAALFAFRLESINYPGAELIVPLVFGVIIGTVVWQGLTAPVLARMLGVAQPEPTGVLFVGGNPVSRALAEALHTEEFTVRIADSGWDNIRAARMSGIPTYFGNPVSEHASRNLKLSGIGHLFAMSQRDDLNALASLHFSHELGRNNVYSLSSSTSSKSKADKHSVSTKQRGNELFGAEYSYAKLASLISKGAELKKTELSSKYSFADLAESENHIVSLLAWDQSKKLKINTDEKPFEPGEGWTVLSLHNSDSTLENKSPQEPESKEND